MITNVTIGSDPEFFVVEPTITGNRKVVPAYNVMPGTKYNPVDFGNGFKTLTDNILAEGNIPPAKTAEEFVNNMKNLKNIIYDNFLSGLDMGLLSLDSASLSYSDLEDPRATEFGCAPYYDAWANKTIRLRDLDKTEKRSAGFHIHVGYTYEGTFKKKLVNIALTRAFDFFVIKWANKVHYDEFREQYYGGFGKMRNTSYGVEFRSLGGYFTKDEFLETVYNKTMNVLEYCNTDDNIQKLLKLTKEDLLTVELPVEVEAITV